VKVSVVLTLLNEGEGLAELLEALLAQSHAADEFVIVDGGSRDSTVRTLQRYADRDARFRLFVEPGANIARGRNLAIERASGDVIAVTDGGCRPDRDWLRELLAPLQADPDVGAVGGRFVPVGDSRFEFYSGLMSVPDLAGESQRAMFYGRSSAFRKALWTQLGGYPEWLYTAEDTLFALGAGRRTDWRIVYAPASLLYWRPRPTIRKLAKMFYLYGRGNGRIQHGKLKGSLFWLRYHAALAITLLLAPWWPWLLVVGVYAGWSLFRGVVQPNLRLVESRGVDMTDRFLHVPLIALARNLATNLGFVRGWLEFRRGADFKRRLEQYLGGSAL
jgi:glycosyltransferase involved in cell wall biosynthesis